MTTWITRFKDGTLLFWNKPQEAKDFGSGTELWIVESDTPISKLTLWAAKGWCESEYLPFKLIGKKSAGGRHWIKEGE